MKTCIACSMPLSNPSDIGAETKDGSACVHCVNSEGTIKNCEEIFEGGVQFFLSNVSNADRALAERLTRKNMKQLTYWYDKASDCLQGEEASDEEFSNALASLGSKAEA